MSARGRTLDLGLATLVGAQLGAAAWLVPIGDRVVTPGGAPLGGLCLVHAMLGARCPFCGLTRSFVALAHGRPGAALRFHPAGPLLFAAMVAFVGAAVIAAIRGAAPLVERRAVVAAFEVVAVVCLVIGGLHNLVRS
jgi:Protein of unknown function (DUF2752)